MRSLLYARNFVGRSLYIHIVRRFRLSCCLRCAFYCALQILQHFFCVAFGLYFFEDVDDLSVWAYYKRRTGHAHYFLSVHVLLFDHAIGIGHFLVSIAQQGKGQAELFRKFILGF